MDTRFDFDEFLSRNFFVNKYIGIDPYDFSNSKYKKLNNLVCGKLTFINKISPVNFRNMLGIKESENSKANALILLTLLKYDYNKYKTEIEFLIQWFINNKSQEFEEFSSGFSFDIDLSVYSSSSKKTSLIISLFVIYGFIEYYFVSRDKQILSYIYSFESLLNKKWLKIENENELIYSYLSDKYVEAYNATAKVGKFYAMLYKINPNEEYLIKINKILNYLFSNQDMSGFWRYAVNNPYIDNFHTVFILDAIFEMLIVYDKTSYLFRNKYELAYKDYKENFFKEFRSYHFHFKDKTKDIRKILITTEIRDCANAIIIFSKMKEFDFALGIWNWTIKHFFNQKTYTFYYLKNSIYTIKINYIRWQAWMAYAYSFISDLE